jgi:OHCU decarboxylase
MRDSKSTFAPRRHTMSELNGWTFETFVQRIGPVFEHSPWIAEATWNRRPFAGREQLHHALCETVAGAGKARQLDLIRAHPDLVGQAALAGTLTPASTREQAGAGLDRLSADEIAAFQTFNRRYREKFGFPFVICARLNKKEAILEGFRRRLDHTEDEEIGTALEEIGKIARFRLADLIE